MGGAGGGRGEGQNDINKIWNREGGCKRDEDNTGGNIIYE